MSDKEAKAVLLALLISAWALWASDYIPQWGYGDYYESCIRDTDGTTAYFQSLKSNSERLKCEEEMAGRFPKIDILKQLREYGYLNSDPSKSNKFDTKARRMRTI